MEYGLATLRKGSLARIIALTLVTCSLSLLSPNLYAQAKNTTPLIKRKESELHHLIKQIKDLKLSIGKARSKQTELNQQLKQADLKLSKLAIALQKTQKKHRQEDLKLAELQQQEQDYQEKLTQQRDTIGKQIRSAYILSKQDYIKIVLNQENMGQLNRVMYYFSYFNHARMQQLKQLAADLDKLHESQQQVAQQTKVLEKLEQQQQHQRAALKRQQTRRQRLLVKLQHQIKTKAQRLKALQGNKQALARVIQRIAKQQTLSAGKPFVKLRGKLPWPTRGRVAMAYGSQVADSELRLNGVILQAKRGQPVYVVANGKVIFADWLRGLGLLMIVEHGNGYITLYGHNQSLLRKVGDVVNAGDEIASVGQSGGLAKPGLYFAIRHDGTPLNPRPWISKRVRV